MSGLSKSRIMNHQQCPKRLWLKVNKPELEEVSDSTHQSFAIGDKVGGIARALYPDGQLINTLNASDALAQTQALLADAPKPIFEAAFADDATLIRADLLLPDDQGWRMVEVKSATHIKDYYLPDIAIQTHIVQQSGIPLTRIEIAHIDNQFVYQGDGQYQGLLKFVDVTDKVAELVKAVPEWIASAKQTLDQCQEPDIAPAGQCTSPNECGFRRYCQPSAFEPVPVHSPEVLPYKDQWAKQIIANGVADLHDVAEEEISKAVYQRIWRTVQTGQPELDVQAKTIIEQLAYPYYFMDFETINPAIPVWTGTRPYQQVPFQWSCHIQGKDGAMTHEEFLADGHSDPRRAFIETLLHTLGDTGTIFIYSSFEITRLSELMVAFPEYQAKIQAVIARIFDLLPLMRNHYYHPDMKGSWSIKAVLPTLAPELRYDNMPVGHGGAAMEAFAEMMTLAVDSERHQELRKHLLDYCELDTLAMVKIVEYVTLIPNPSP